ncbi:MAG: ABC transporter ATP-binding protein/permease [Chitinophagales bacterium]|nr:ABC transporter ATP-binding protein/permease [Chitinophagales bacterium]
MSQTEIKTSVIKDWPILKRVLTLAQPFIIMLWICIIMGILAALITSVRPWLTQVMVDDYIVQYDENGLKKMALLVAVTLIAEFLIKYIFSYYTADLGQSVIKYLRVKVFNHAESLKLKFFDKTPIGIVTTRTINDVEAVSNIFSEGFITIISDVLTFIVVIIFMLSINWKLALACIVTFPFIIWGTYIFKEAIKDSFNEVREKVALMNAFVQEHITGMKIVQIFNAQDREYEKFDLINQDHRDANLKSVWYFSIFFPLVEVILSIAVAIMLWYGAKLIIAPNSMIEVGIFIAFYQYLNLAFRPLRMLADKFNTLQMGIVAANRVFKILDTDEKIPDNGTFVPQKVKGEIEFKDVWFAYNHEEYVLKGINFHVLPGETMALVGATGSGKTSIINVLNRFYEIQKGEIFIDGVVIQDYRLAALRSSIGVVMQDVFLFSGSIMDNITLKNPKISREKVIEAAKIIGAHKFIMDMPGDYDYNVMERGATISAGQRQLISFIRVLVYNPSILVLDEATSSIDTESELLIQEAIDKLVKGRTSIIIAHRLSTIQNANQIIVLEHGLIKEVGNHESLLEKEDGYYRNLVELQFAH